MKIKKLALVATALAASFTFSGCAAANNNEEEKEEIGIVGQLPEQPLESNTSSRIEVPEEVPAVKPQTPAVSEPKVKKASYISVTSNSVNIRSGAGTGYSALGTAEKSTLYTLLGEENGWYKTKYRNKTAYISKNYCVITEMTKSDNEKIEAVIAEGANVLGTPYVYGAVRLHDGKGNMYKNFTTDAFDCSSLMQYMFYKGADKLIDVNTRTQIYQGTTVSKSNLKRGDLMFFTNSSRKDNTGIERVGHVAIYLGDNWILHTASDYAKIEQISSTRWGYFIQAQRIL